MHRYVKDYDLKPVTQARSDDMAAAFPCVNDAVDTYLNVQDIFGRSVTG